MHRREFLKSGGSALALAALPIPLSISEPVLTGPDAMAHAVPAQAEKKG